MSFNIFGSQQRDKPDPFLKLKKAIALLPEFYRIEPAFSDCIRLLGSHDPKAVDGLLTLTKVDGHYFSNAFWVEVSESAMLLSLPAQASYCKQKIDRNTRELDDQIPEGWTTVKLGNSPYASYQHYIAQSIKDRWGEERRRKHHVSEFLSKDGFHLVRDGRGGMIYYVNSDKLIEIEIELSGNPAFDIIVYFHSVTHCALPKRIELTQEERNQLKPELIQWLSSEGIRASLGEE
jgi:hypothetical protein